MHKVELVYVYRYAANGHLFVFKWTKSNWREMLRELGRQAADLGHPLTWFDAALLSRKIRKAMEGVA
jgi:hypothetical protein